MFAVGEHKDEPLLPPHYSDVCPWCAAGRPTDELVLSMIRMIGKLEVYPHVRPEQLSTPVAIVEFMGAVVRALLTAVLSGDQLLCFKAAVLTAALTRTAVLAAVLRLRNDVRVLNLVFCSWDQAWQGCDVLTWAQGQASCPFCCLLAHCALKSARTASLRAAARSRMATGGTQMCYHHDSSTQSCRANCLSHSM